MLGEISLSAIPRPIPTVGLPKIPTTICATTTSSTNSNTKLSTKLPAPKPVNHNPDRNTPPDPNKPIINPITNRKSYDHITDRELRKKLKNRESAQAARDRKKAKMLALERQLADMAERNKILENENRELRGRIQRMEAEAFWRLVKNPADGSMEGNPMAAMMNQGMHPGAMAGHGGMIPGQTIETPAGSGAPSAHEIQQIQINEQQRLYQRQMQFLLEGNPSVAAAALHGQAPQASNQSGTSTPAGQMPPTQPMTSSSSQSASTGSTPATSTASSKSSNQSEETIELSHVTSAVFPSIRLPITKGEPMDEDCLPDVGSVSPDSGRHLSHQSELISADLGNGLDDYILRSFKGETSPGSTGKQTGSTGFSSGCESPDGNNGAPSSPEFVVSTNWTNNRSASSDSGNFSPSHRVAFPPNCDFKIKA